MRWRLPEDEVSGSSEDSAGDSGKSVKPCGQNAVDGACESALAEGR